LPGYFCDKIPNTINAGKNTIAELKLFVAVRDDHLDFFLSLTFTGAITLGGLGPVIGLLPPVAAAAIFKIWILSKTTQLAPIKKLI